MAILFICSLWSIPTIAAFKMIPDSVSFRDRVFRIY